MVTVVPLRVSVATRTYVLSQVEVSIGREGDADVVVSVVAKPDFIDAFQDGRATVATQ